MRHLRLAVLLALCTLALPATAAAHTTPATPGTLWTSWSPDPFLITVLLLAAVAYTSGARQLWQRAGYGRGLPYWRLAAYLGGLLTVAVAVISPLDALSAALFSAHMTQHLLLILVAAPLLVLGAPLVPALWLLPARTRRTLTAVVKHNPRVEATLRLLSSALLILLAHAVTIWLWHIPSFYDATLRHRWLHTLEHASFLATAVMFWWVVIPVAGRRVLSPGLAVLYVFLAAMQSSMLGVLLLLSRAAWYEAHVPHLAAWNMTPLEDQQLAGAIMWIPAGVIYAATALALFGIWLANIERSARVARLDPER